MTDIILSIVIVTYKRHIPLCNTLHAIGPFIRNKIIELLVIDQCPVEELPNTFINIPNLRYVVLDKPGMVRARNIGLELAKGDIVLFLDDDIVPSSDLIDAHMVIYLLVALPVEFWIPNRLCLMLWLIQECSTW